MIEYIYNRKCGKTEWQINIGENNPILEIIKASLFLVPKIECNGDIVKLYFKDELTIEQKNNLDNIINNYIANKPEIKESKKYLSRLSSFRQEKMYQVWVMF